MLLTLTLRRALLAIGTASGVAAMPPAGATELRAQDTSGAAADLGDSLRRVGPRHLEPVLTSTAHAVRLWTGIECTSFAACAPVTHAAQDEGQDQPARVDQRGRFALIGLLVGAAAGWGLYAYQCSHGSDCYSPVGGVLLAAAGGVLGILVGILVAPAPGSS